jgi:hypothetical protein
MISVCAREITLGPVMMWALIIVLIGSCVSRVTWQRAKHTVFLHKGTAVPDYTHGTCHPINFTALKPSDWTRGTLQIGN